MVIFDWNQTVLSLAAMRYIGGKLFMGVRGIWETINGGHSRYRADNP